MESGWGMTDEQRKVAIFTDNLAEEIKENLTNKEGHTTVRTYALDKNSGFIIGLDYNHKHGIEIMVSKSRGENRNEGELTIDRFFGIKPISQTRRESSSPDELRFAAQIYDEMTKFLDNKFGYPIEHPGSAIYRTKLKETVTV